MTVENEKFSFQTREPSLVIRIGLKQCNKGWFEIEPLHERKDILIPGDVVTEHNRFIDDHGRVLFGRYEELCPRWWNLLYNFVGLHKFENGRSSRWGVKLILFIRRGRDYAGYSTRAFWVGNHCPDPLFVPESHRDLIPHSHVWFEIGRLSLMTRNELGQYLRDIAYAIRRKRRISRTLVDACHYDRARDF